jgi:hypothetical protein
MRKFDLCYAVYLSCFISKNIPRVNVSLLRGGIRPILEVTHMEAWMHISVICLL